MSASISTQGDAQVLTFSLDEQQYCVSIDNIAEIVNFEQTLTKLPETPPHVEGIVDLRGRTTTVVNPKSLLDTDGDSEGHHVVVFEPDDDAENQMGWVVDEVLQVIGINDSEVDDSVESTLSQGVVRTEDETFLIWLDPTSFDT